MAFGNRTLKFDTLAIANPTASSSIAQQEVRASDVNIDPSILETGSLNLIGAGMVDVGNFEPINPSEEPPIVEQPSTESPTDETPTDDSGEVEEPLADAQPETETETEPEYQPEEEAKTNISGGTTEIGFPAWFENSLKKGGMIAGLGVLGFIGYKVADATGVIDKITEKKPAAKTTQKKDKMMAESCEHRSFTPDFNLESPMETDDEEEEAVIVPIFCDDCGIRGETVYLHGYNEYDNSNLSWFDAETFGADYSLYDRKTKQKVGVKSGYYDFKDAYDDWKEEIVNKYPNRVSENEWIVIDTHNAETFEARDDSWCVNHGWIHTARAGDIIPCTSCNDMICEGCRCGGCGNCENSDCCECKNAETVERGWIGDNLPPSKEERLRDLKEKLKYLIIMRTQLQRLYNSLMPFTTGMVGHLPRMEKKMSDMVDFVEPKIRHYNQLIDETQEKISRMSAETFDAETFNAPMLMCGVCGEDKPFICRECGNCPDCYCDVDCFDQKNTNPILMKAKIKTSLRGEIRDLQNQKAKLDEYMQYGLNPPAMWEYDIHEQKSIEPFFPQRLSRMNKFYQKELNRINDIDAQIEDLISYLEWIDEFYGTREE